MRETDALLSIRNLTVDYDTENRVVNTLNDVSFDIPTGKIVGVVGESGCGKSTLINTVLGLLAGNGKVRQGSILFEGTQDLTKLSPKALTAIRGRDISVVFQDPMNALNPVRTIGDQMRDVQYRSGTSRREKTARAIEMLKRVRMPDVERRLDQFPHEFSGGMKQRIAIAMSLLLNPKLLIADEPTTALDATLELAAIDLLRDLQREIGCAVLFISHHLGVIAELCEHVVIMYAGEVVEQGPVSAVFADPRHPYTRLLLACDPANGEDVSARLPTIPGEIPDLSRRPAGCIFADRCDRVEDKCRTATPPDLHPSADRLAKCWFALEEQGR
jgi:oligopeptide/dipeptide ABC transporter ATP-binding protein